jgi:2-C-methyl-D-erythritol 2,4-cyclodiphosphate synthase
VGILHVGVGFDAHGFDESRPLILGGVRIEGARGLSGHSDGDVVCHAIADALLGAAGLGDLGENFPSNDTWKDASSLDILRRVVGMLDDSRVKIVNVDATVVTEVPRLTSHRSHMIKAVSEALGGTSQVSLKATTTDGLGFTGRGEGIAAFAVALVEEASQ